MGRKKQWPPRIVRHAASGQDRVYLDGRYVYLGPSGSEESRQNYADVLARAADVPLPPDASARRAGLTVAELLERHLVWARDYYCAGQAARVATAAAFAVRHHAALSAARFGPLALEEVRGEMVATGWTRGVVNSHVGCLKRAWRWAASRELVPASAAHALASLPGLKLGRTPAPEGAGVAPVPDELVDDTLPWLRPEVADMVRIQRLTGMRSGEVCVLRAEEIDRTAAIWAWRPKHHKTAHAGKRRLVLFGPKAQTILAPHLESVREGYVFSPARVVAAQHRELRAARKSRVQPSQRARKKPVPRIAPGERYTANSYQAAIRRACRRAGLPEWRSGQLRHSAASQIRAEFGIEAAQAVLGHSKIETTQIYAEKDMKAALDVAKKAG